jgi:LysR family transcriptional regulator, regulator for bpeEF and oprC
MDRLASMRVFVRVVEANSFARAALQLDLSRAMATTHVARLERYLGVRLINRTTRRLSLTDDGQLYYARCIGILAEVDDAETNVRRSRGVARGRLRVEMPIAFARHWVIPVLPGFLDANGELTLEIGLENRMTDLLAQGYDCGVRSGELSNSTLTARRIGALEWVTCASAGYLRRHGVPRHPKDLADHECVVWLSARTMQPSPWHFERDGERTSVEVRGALHLNAMEDIAVAAEAGLGIGRTLRKLADAGLRAGRLRRVLPNWSAPPQPMSIVYPHGRYAPAKVAIFADFLAETLRRSARAEAGGGSGGY